MRYPIRVFAAFAVGVAIITSCDDGPTVSRFGSGISGGPTGTAPIVPPAPGSVDSFPPFARINTPVAAPVQLINIGDSILVETLISDDRQLSSMTVTGYKLVGDPDLGTFQRIPRYRQIVVPVSGSFRAGLTDTTIRRYLQPATPLDTVPGDLVIEVVATDGGGNTFVAQRTVRLVTGPVIAILNPQNGQEVPRGVAPMGIDVRVTHGTGVSSITVTVTSGANFTTPVNATQTFTFGTGTTQADASMAVPIPANAPLGGLITINASAIDVNGNPGTTAPVTVRVREAGLVAPAVSQVVAPRLEIDDSVVVVASGDGITSVGYVLVDRTTGVEFKRFSQAITLTSNTPPIQLPLNLTLSEQGRRFHVYSFATDNNTPPLTGYSRSSPTGVPISIEANAFRDTTLIAHGRTFKLPRDGIVGDIATDPLGNVFVSNTNFNLLEVWQNPTEAFDPNGIRVGSLPWGLFVSNDPDTLLVANSGATTISKVFVGTTTPASMQENLNTRIRTRENVIFQVSLAFDAAGHIRLGALPRIAYSDRPQYVAQSEAGRLFYSTRPTSAATPGTIRWMDPTLTIPDPQQITAYGETISGSDQRIYTFFNADSVVVFRNLGTGINAGSDWFVVYDHPYGLAGPVIFALDSVPPDAQVTMNGLNSDIQVALNFDVSSLALTDTTFVSASGDRRWIGFGEGNTEDSPGRLMLIQDPVGTPTPPFFSPAITVTDIVDNASERVFGMALDSTGLQVTAHGLQTYMAAVDQPFHLRLEGVYDSFDNGAGVAYHPRAKSTLSNPDHRVAFTATDNGVIEVIDVAHYNNRGRLVSKGNLYGPLRVSGVMPGDNVGLTCTGVRATDDPNCVVLKILGVSSTGLVVIDVQWKDINPQ